ncbi:hypothetical protein JYU34_008596 [Plutella xylostella]|uniref:Uncharacterized protein n=1 Tax=Plutella xylostella TaxID=51655 RepID=A0ABQ7QLB5_PLUXY|nr:hypothetical protein JYU34_008596 [Plutella xylostella]
MRLTRRGDQTGGRRGRAAAGRVPCRGCAVSCPCGVATSPAAAPCRAVCPLPHHTCTLTLASFTTLKINKTSSDCHLQSHINHD